MAKYQYDQVVVQGSTPYIAECHARAEMMIQEANGWHEYNRHTSDCLDGTEIILCLRKTKGEDDAR
jgi:hypothetical protein